MQKTSCLVCGEDKPRFLLSNKKDPFLKNINAEETTYVICESCGFVYQNPTLDEQEIDRLYSQDYYDKKDKNSFEKYAIKKEEYAEHTFDWIATHVDVLRDSPEKPKILDIGCNTGALLALFQKCGWDCYGNEPSRNMASIAKERYGLANVSKGFFKEGTYDSETLTLVCLLHTLEHLEKPHVILKDIRSALLSDGLLYIEVPNVYRPKSSFYTSFFAAPHLYAFSHVTLQRLLAKNGFTVVFKGDLPRGICVLARKSEAHDLNQSDSLERVTEITHTYKKKHDVKSFLYRYVANTLPVRAVIKLRVPLVWRLLSKFRDAVRVNKIV